MSCCERECVRVHARVCVFDVFWHGVRGHLCALGVVDGLHTMRAVQWRLTVLYVCVRMLFVLVAVAACWCIFGGAS